MKFIINDMKKIGRSVRFAYKGLRHAYHSDKSFRMEINYGIPIYLSAGWLLSPMRADEFLWFSFSYLLILIVELVNTAFETMLSRLHPEEHETIGRSKDVASAAVLCSFIFAIVVVTILVVERVFLGTSVIAPSESPFV